VDDQDKQALTELEALVKVKGALRIITSEVRPELREDRKDPRSPFKGSEAALLDPATFVLHDVERIEVSAHRGVVRAYSTEGDWTEGRPAAVLKRLREHRGS
jgi:hypothetical protein